MSTEDSHKQRGLSDSDKSDPVMNDNRSKFKLDYGLLCNFPQLMFGHFPVRFVIDSLDFAAILRGTNDPLEINSCTCSGIHSILRRTELRICHQNFTNRICHKVQVIATVSRGPLVSSYWKKISK